MKAFFDADVSEGATYQWRKGYEYLENGSTDKYVLDLDALKDMPVGSIERYSCDITDKFGNTDTVTYEIVMKKILVFDKNVLNLGLTKTGTVNATMASGDKIVKVVPVNTKVATATWNGSKITVKAGTVGGASNIAVKTESGKVVKFKVIVPKPTLSFTYNSKAVSLNSPMTMGKSKNATVAAKMANGDSIVKVVPTNFRATCTYSGNKITVKAGKTTGYVNIAVKTKCGKVVKFRVHIK